MVKPNEPILSTNYIPKTKLKTKLKQKSIIKIYIDNSNYCIDVSAAYALGFLNVEEFNNAESKYYYINNETLNMLKEKYDIEINSLNLENNINIIK